MNNVIFIYENGNNSHEKRRIISILENIFKKEKFVTTIFEMKPKMDSRELSNLLINDKFQYVCTVDMAGFQIGTLQEVPFYDICPSKQIHIVLDNRCFNLFKNQTFALNLYMILPGRTEELQKQYPDIINILGYNKLEGNESDKVIFEEIVMGIFEEVKASEMYK